MTKLGSVGATDVHVLDREVGAAVEAAHGHLEVRVMVKLQRRWVVEVLVAAHVDAVKPEEVVVADDVTGEVARTQ